MRSAVDVVTLPGLRKARGPAADLVKAVLAAEGAGGSVVVALVDEPTMSELNGRFRGLPEPTDVLTFRQADIVQEWPDPTRKSGVELGEIAVCPEVVERYATVKDGDPDRQLGRTLIHGVLHLLGYDHDRDHGQMYDREQALLAALDREVRVVSAAAAKAGGV